MAQTATLSSLLKRLTMAKVAVVGDVVLDRYVEGNVERISPEAPIPIFSVRREESMLGAAGNVLRNLSALGASARIWAGIGDDVAGTEVAKMIAEVPNCISSLQTIVGRQTSIKTRFIAAGQQIMRADRETIEDIPRALQDAIVADVARELATSGALLLSDYGKGVLVGEFVERLIKVARENFCPVIVDPKGNDYRRYRGAHVVTPNRQELAFSTNMPVTSDDETTAACRHLIQVTGVLAVLATRSEQGMTLVSEDNVHHLPTRAREVFDVSGAGDTVAATVAAALAAGTELPDAARLANTAAGVVVGKAGTAVVYPEEVAAAERESNLMDADSKVLSAMSLVERVIGWRRQVRCVGFTNGCFDLLHPGHVSLIREARRSCDRLVVGLNSDTSVKRLKGTDRPVQNERSRAAVLASLADVDAVVVFEEDTPIDLIRSLKPDVLVKGADYTPQEVVGAEDVKRWGGKVILVDLLDGHSTTETIRRIGK
tara:strand:- start:234 stop:1694 length:1461 start_codon:yes stop_codon:yes gene_type:complete